MNYDNLLWYADIRTGEYITCTGSAIYDNIVNTFTNNNGKILLQGKCMYRPFQSLETLDIDSENCITIINNKNEFEIETSLGKILEHKPITFYQNSKESINSKFKRTGE